MSHTDNRGKFMNTNSYKLSLKQHNNQTCLQLHQNGLQIRKWFGSFATMVFNRIIRKYSTIKQSQTTAYLRKNQMHGLFTEVTCLYQQALCHYKVEQDLIKIKPPKNYCCIAESLLLHIRMNEIHPSHDDLLCFFLDVYQNRDYKIFSETITLLLNHNLIQVINTTCGKIFYDKNPEPHDHIYFKEHDKLVDCDNETSSFLESLTHVKIDTSDEANIYCISEIK